MGDAMLPGVEFSLAVPPVRQAPAICREALRPTLIAAGLGEEEILRCLIVISEAVGFFVLYPPTGPDASILVEARVAEASVVLTVSTARPVAFPRTPNLNVERGDSERSVHYSFRVMRALADSVIATLADRAQLRLEVRRRPPGESTTRPR